MPIWSYLYIGLGSVALGYIGFLIVAWLLPRRLKSDQDRQREEILADARRQAKERLELERRHTETKLTLLAEELTTDIEDRKAHLKTLQEDLESRHRTYQIEEARVQKMEQALESRRAKVESRRQALEDLRSNLKEARSELVRALAARAETTPEAVLKSLRDNAIEARQIEAQKILKMAEEELEVSARRLSQRMLARTMSRYAPEFYWPKSINFVELMEPRLVEQLSGEHVRLLADMREIAEIEVDLLAEKQEHTPIIKLAGGAGINREAVRLALTELLPKGPNAWSKAAEAYRRHRETLEQEAIRLGKKAVTQLRLKGIHPEIQKLVGYLNWRTSYRQNQWYHTVEVATLAGILAHEVGVDPDQAKRCGLLHDIGKALDYKIEGSHAVISGDYADRFGEKRVICDTVMSHHNDLVLETALSYVLKAADTLSGARPGARVNLEEGYQIRLSGIDAAVRSFPGVTGVAIMNGAREVHVEVNHKRVKDADLPEMSRTMAKKISEEVAFPGEIKIVISRVFEATSVA